MAPRCKGRRVKSVDIRKSGDGRHRQRVLLSRSRNGTSTTVAARLLPLRALEGMGARCRRRRAAPVHPQAAPSPRCGGPRRARCDRDCAARLPRGRDVRGASRRRVERMRGEGRGLAGGPLRRGPRRGALRARVRARPQPESGRLSRNVSTVCETSSGCAVEAVRKRARALVDRALVQVSTSRARRVDRDGFGYWNATPAHPRR